MLIKRLLCVLLLSLFLGFGSAATNSHSSEVALPCRVGQQAPAIGFWTWAANTHVKVYTRNSDFNADQMSYLMAALAKWNDVSEQTRAGVRFEYQGNTTEELQCEKCLTIMRGVVFDKSQRHVTQLNAFSLHHDQLISYATIIVDRKLTNAKALLKALAHELGHNLGLLDCYTCKQKSTVMNQFKVINKADDMGGPTPCDIAQVKEAYRELKIHVRPSPAHRDFDDGEDPVDDDTPIVIPHP